MELDPGIREPMSRPRCRRGSIGEFEDRVPNKCGGFMEQRCRNQGLTGGSNQMLLSIAKI